MKSTFSKWLVVFAIIGGTTLIMQSANGRPTARPSERTTIGSAPQAIVMDTQAPTVDSRVDLRHSRMAE